MQAFTKCPICGDPLINIPNATNGSIMYKSCNKRLDHRFGQAILIINEDSVMRTAFTLSVEPPLSVKFEKDDLSVRIHTSLPSRFADLPDNEKLPFYFEPDFSDYKRLVEKIKTYILFS